MRILFVITSSHIGGTEKFLYQLVTRLDTARFQAVVCSLKKPGYFARCLQQQGIRVYSLDMPEKVNGLTPVYFLLGFVRLLYIIKKGKFDLIHSLLYRANLLARLAGSMGGVSQIISSERCLTRHKHPLAVWFDRCTVPMSTYVLANSKAVAEQLRVRERVNPEKIRIIYSGMDQKEQLSQERITALKSSIGISSQEYVIGCVARLHPDKGLEDLLRAGAIIGGKFSSFRILLVGDGPQRAYLQELAHKLGIGQQVVFTGFRSDVDSLIQTFNLFVLPSLEEGFSLSIMEAMVFGIPVIATRVGGMPEIIISNKTGVLVPPHEPRILAREILRLIHNPGLAQKLGKAGELQVKNKFSFPQCLEQIENLYEGKISPFGRNDKEEFLKLMALIFKILSVFGFEKLLMKKCR